MTPTAAHGERQIEMHRRECEARWVLTQPFGKRRPHLEMVGKRRGEAARTELEAEVKRQYQLMKAPG